MSTMNRMALWHGPSRRAVGAALAVLLAACAPRQERVRTPQPDTPAQPEAEARPEPVAPLRIGVILPQEGTPTLRQYAEQVRAGIEIAFAAAGRDVEVVTVDDGGDPTRAAEQTRRLEAQGVVAIVGPLLGASLDAAAAARTDPMLALISPTSSERPTGRNAYTLNAGDARGGEALAGFALARGLRDVALLYPAGAEFRELTASFRTTIEAGGGRVVADVPWQPGTTTFAAPLERIRNSRGRALFVAASERDIRQLAPQMAYYGVGGMQILGSEAWASEEVLARVDPQLLEGVVAAVPFLPASRAVAWNEFVALYETAQRRSLDSPYPALGWDAARLVLDALGEERAPTRADVARRLAAIDAFRGATGVFSLAQGAVTRRPFLVRIRGGRAEPIPDNER